MKNLNRAVQDDIVAIEILPKNEWVTPSSLVLESKDEELEEEEQDKKVSIYKSSAMKLYINIQKK